jgi:hypothetical protein
MWRNLILSVLLFLLPACSALFAQTKNYNVWKGDGANCKISSPPEGCGDGGTCFWIDMDAPGNITGVDYNCEGKICGWVHPCPDGGKCHGHVYEFEISGQTARFWAWTNSGDTDAVYKFTIHYQ